MQRYIVPVIKGVPSLMTVLNNLKIDLIYKIFEIVF